jgi:hypothetical protein
MAALILQIEEQYNKNRLFEFNNSEISIEEVVKYSILNDLFRLNWEIKFLKNKLEIVPPSTYDKLTIKQ